VRSVDEEKGVSSIIGFVMVSTILMVAISTYVVQQMPYDWKKEEYNAMLEVKNAFLTLREQIQQIERGDVVSVPLPLGAISPHPVRGGSSGAEIEIETAKSVSDVSGFETNANAFDWWRAVDTYVKESAPGFNYQSPDYENEHLWVSTTENSRVWTFLKFDLSDSGLYNSYEYKFRDDVVIHQALLMLYVVDADLSETPTDRLGVLVPQQVEVWGLENDAWWEGLDWTGAQRVHDPTRDTKIENVTIDTEGRWAVWDVTQFVKKRFEPLLGWGKWAQYKWYYPTDALEIGRFSPDYSRYASASGVDDGSVLTGTGVNGTLTSSVFDAGAVVFWNYVGFDNVGGSVTVELRFDNDPDFSSPTAWQQVADGSSPGVYARLVQYRVSGLDQDEYFDNMVLEYTGHVSFVLREPWEDGENFTTTLKALVRFNSGDNSRAEAFGFEPVLRVVYSRTSRVGYASQGVVNFGYIKFKGNTEQFPETNYCFEGGAVFVERGAGWYRTLVAYPSDFVVVTPTDEIIVEPDGTVKRVAVLSVTRYQIAEASIDGEAVEGLGASTIRVVPEEFEWLVEPPTEPNTDEVTITVVSDHPDVWRDVLKQIAAEVNYVLTDYEEYYAYGPYTAFDYDSVSLTIRGDPGEGETAWIFKYSEQVVWLDVSVGTFLGGRT
jgi:hypothetical protein